MNPVMLYGAITLGSMAVLFIVSLILYSRIQQKRHFLCPRCGARFKAAGMRTFFASRHGVDRMLTCPRCGITDYMENIPDEEYTEEMRKADEEERKRDMQGEDDE